MKIGFSLGRCVLDIYEHRVPIKDIVVIITNTMIDPNKDHHWTDVWDSYTSYNAVWSHIPKTEEDAMRQIVKDLHMHGLLHQPRSFVPSELAVEKGLGFRWRGYHWMECVLVPEELMEHPSAKDAWERYQVLAGLIG